MRRHCTSLASAALTVLLVCFVVLVGVAEETQAAYPGKNGKIAFVSAGQIYTVGDDGSDQKALAAGHEPVWSPDGTKIAFVGRGEIRDSGDWYGSHGYNEIYVMDADGSNIARITNFDAQEDPTYEVAWTISDLTWSPDGTQMVFEERTDDLLFWRALRAHYPGHKRGWFQQEDLGGVRQGAELVPGRHQAGLLENRLLRYMDLRHLHAECGRFQRD